MNNSDIVLFETKDSSIVLPVRMTGDTVWLNRSQMAELFERDVKTIGKHINNALREEVDSSTVAKFATVQEEGRKKMIPLKEVLEIYISILADRRYIRRCKRRQQIFSIL